MAGPQCHAQTLSRNVIIYFLGWLDLHLHDVVGYHASKDWMSKSIGNLTLPIQIIIPWLQHYMCDSRWEQLFAAFLNWIKLILALLQPSCDRGSYGTRGAHHMIHLPRPWIQVKIITNTFQPMPGFILRHDPKHFVLFLNYNNFNRFLLSVNTIQCTCLTILMKCCYIVCVQVPSKPSCLHMSGSREWQVFHLIVSSYHGVEIIARSFTRANNEYCGATLKSLYSVLVMLYGLKHGSFSGHLKKLINSNANPKYTN